MDTAEEAVSYDQMDHSEVNRIFVADFLAECAPKSAVLDVGTGTAQIPIELCRQSATAEILAIDLSKEMLRVGDANVRRANLSPRIRLQLVDAKGLPFADGQFCAVISNSIVHHIPEPIHVLAEMARVTAPGGRIFVRDLLRPDSLEQRNGLVGRYAGGADAKQQQLFAQSLHAALRLDEVREMAARLGFRPDSVRQTSDRHWTWSALKSK
jgi:ubiquinone/menaquinone biosynthesis C-methylase UbiE